MNTCQELAGAFYGLAENKDSGATKASQAEMVRETSSEVSYKYMMGILEIIYAHPELKAPEIQEQFLAHCSVNSENQAIVQPSWDPWRH